MPYPTTSNAVPRQDLAGPLEEWALNRTALIGLKVAPGLAVSEEAGDLTVLASERQATLGDTNAHGDGEGTPIEDYDVESLSYKCLSYWNGHCLTDRRRARFASRFDGDVIGSRMALNKLLMKHEARVAALLINETNFPASGTTGVTIAGGAEWSNTSGGSPLGDVQTGVKALTLKNGVPPDTLIVPAPTLFHLTESDQVQERIKYVFGIPSAELNLSQLAQLMGLRQILVGGAAYNSAVEGQTHVGAWFWNTEYAFLCYTSAEDPMLAPQVMRTLYWEGDGGLMTAEQFRDEDKAGDVFRVRQSVDELLIGGNRFGYLIKNIA